MKHYLRMALLVATVLILGAGVSACGGKDHEPVNPFEKPAIYVLASYNVAVDPNWITYFDVKVVYTDAAGVEQTVNMDTDSWSRRMEIPIVHAPSQFSASVVAVPKADAPSVDTSKAYNFGHSIIFNISGLDSGKLPVADYGQQFADTELRNMVEGAELASFLSTTHTISSFSWKRPQ